MPKSRGKKKKEGKDPVLDKYAQFERCDLVHEVETIFTFVGANRFTYLEVRQMLENKFQVDLNTHGYKALIRGAVLLVRSKKENSSASPSTSKSFKTVMKKKKKRQSTPIVSKKKQHSSKYYIPLSPLRRESTPKDFRKSQLPGNSSKKTKESFPKDRMSSYSNFDDRLKRKKPKRKPAKEKRKPVKAKKSHAEGQTKPKRKPTKTTVRKGDTRIHWQPVEKRKFFIWLKKNKNRTINETLIRNSNDEEIQFLRKGLGSGKPRTVQAIMAKYTRRKGSLWYSQMEEEFRSNAGSSIDKNNNDESNSEEEEGKSESDLSESKDDLKRQGFDSSDNDSSHDESSEDDSDSGDDISRESPRVRRYEDSSDTSQDVKQLGGKSLVMSSGSEEEEVKSPNESMDILERGRSGYLSSGSENDFIPEDHFEGDVGSPAVDSLEDREMDLRVIKNLTDNNNASSEVDWKKEHEKLKELLRQSQESNLNLQRKYDDLLESKKNESHHEPEVNKDNNDNQLDLDVNSPYFDDSHHDQSEIENVQEGGKIFNPVRSLQWVTGGEFREEDWNKLLKKNVEVKIKKIDYDQNDNESTSSPHSVPDQSINEEMSEEKNIPGKKVTKADLCRDFDIADDEDDTEGPASDNIPSTSGQENFPDNFKSRDAKNLELVKIPFSSQKSKKGSKKTKNKGKKKTSKATNPHEKAGIPLRHLAEYKNRTHSFAEEMARISHDHQMRKAARDKKKKLKKMSRIPKLNKKGQEEGKKEDKEGSDKEGSDKEGSDKEGSDKEKEKETDKE